MSYEKLYEHFHTDACDLNIYSGVKSLDFFEKEEWLK